MTSHAIATGDVLETLRQLPDNTFDAILTDPPYGLGTREPTIEELIAYLQGAEANTGGDFMGKKWTVPSVAVWRESMRVLKPGGLLLSFGGTRMFWIIALGLRAAGLELRDCLTWLYAKGFPKSQEIGLAIDTAVLNAWLKKHPEEKATYKQCKKLVKKANEADRKLLENEIARIEIAADAHREVIGTRVLTGNAAIDIEEKGGTYGVQVGSIPPKEVNITSPATELAKQWDGFGTALKPAWEPILLARKPLEGTMANNVAKWACGGLDIDACRIEGQEWTQEEWSAKCATRTAPNTYGEHSASDSEVPTGRWPANLVFNEEGAALLDVTIGNRPSRPSITANGGGNHGGAVYTDRATVAKPNGGYSDSGGPSRFFFCAKVSTKERELGCEALPRKSAGEMTEREDGQDGLDNPRAGAGRTGGAHNHHPTLKPIALVQWLASLVKPPTENATILVPYCGAGSEMIGACLAGWPNVLGIENEPDYVAIANVRLAEWIK